ncbi:MAG: biotin--[acetyl-CoA-carboxylase] ligase [Candidatus Aminicenantes bacterium]|nr:biotin--[acetyl-CoA-carboxylase] ligase [Candidatus Aminicenantes bacterium]
MKVLTDNTVFAENTAPETVGWRLLTKKEEIPGCPEAVLSRFFSRKRVWVGTLDWPLSWTCFFLVEESSFSQYDSLIELSREHVRMEDGTVCLAGIGRDFHGQKKRPWISLPGNLHLSFYLKPNIILQNFGAAFMILGAASVVQAIDEIEYMRGKAGIKWVNDILVDDAKVAGILTHTQSMEDMVTSAVIGVGINVEQDPSIRSDRFTGKTASLRSLAVRKQDMNMAYVLKKFLYFMDANYQELKKGKVSRLLEFYRSRSVFMGKKVRVVSDKERGREKEIACGRMTGIGENLELYIEGFSKPISSGRIIVSPVKQKTYRFS